MLSDGALRGLKPQAAPYHSPAAPAGCGRGPGAPARFARAVRDEDLAAITAINGVGRKTAERLVIELRDKLGFLPVAAAAPSEVAPSRGRRPTKVLAGAERYEDAVGALVTLGYTQAQAAETVRRVSEDGGDPSAEALLRRSLVLLRPARVSR